MRRARSPALLTCAVALAASATMTAGADAGGQPFPLSLGVTGSSTAGVNAVSIVATSVAGARCGLEVRAGTTVKRFPSARAGALASASPPAAAPPGASCDEQGVCFAGDPFPVGECTWYAAGRRPDLLDVVHGSAGAWLEEARGRVPEGWVPVVGAVAVWLPDHDGAGEDGHVAYVAAVSAGRALVDDSNWLLTPGSAGLQVHEHWVSVVGPSGYIYGGPAGGGPGE